MSRATFTRRAEAQLEAIGDYIAQDNPRRAQSFTRELRERCDLLTVFPQTGTPCPPQYGPEVRRIVFHRYLIFYRPTGDGVTVLRIFHSAQDIKQEMFQ